MERKINDAYHRAYINSLFKYQGENELTCCEMADLLGVSTSTYKNIISGRTATIELSLIMRMYFLNKTPMYRMVGVKPPVEFETYHRYINLSNEDQKLVADFIDMLLVREGKDPYDLSKL